MGDKMDSLDLPRRIFMYTLDQVADVLNVTRTTLNNNYIWYFRRQFGVKDPHKITARNVAPDDATPDWRVSEDELHRYLKFKGFKFTRSGTY